MILSNKERDQKIHDFLERKFAEHDIDTEQEDQAKRA